MRTKIQKKGKFIENLLFVLGYRRIRDKIIIIIIFSF